MPSTRPSPDDPTIAARVAIVLATLGVTLCLIGSILTARVVRFTPTMLEWLLVLVALAGTVGIEIIIARRIRLQAIAVGGLSGFVVVTITGLGALWAPGTAVLIIAVAVNIATAPSWCIAGRAAVQFVAGASGVCIVLIAIDVFRTHRYGIEVTHVPIIVSGSWVFGSTIAIAVLCRLLGICRGATSHSFSTKSTKVKSWSD